MMPKKDGSEENKKSTEKCPDDEPQVTSECFQSAVLLC